MPTGSPPNPRHVGAEAEDNIELQRRHSSAADLLTHYFEVHFDDVASELAAAGPKTAGPGTNAAIHGHEVASAQLRRFIRSLIRLRGANDITPDVFQVVAEIEGLTPYQDEMLRGRITAVLGRLGLAVEPNGDVDPAKVAARPAPEAPMRRAGALPDGGRPRPRRRRVAETQPKSAPMANVPTNGGTAPDEAREANEPSAPALAARAPRGGGSPRPRSGTPSTESATATASVLNSLMARCVTDVRADLCQVFIVDDDGSLTLRAESPAEGGAVTGPRVLSPREGFAGRVSHGTRPVTLIHRDELAGNETTWEDRGIVRLAGVSVGNPGDAGSGILVAGRTSRRQFNDDDLAELAGISGEVTVALATADLVARAEELAVLKERMKLAREIHDGLASDLSAVVALFKYHEGRKALDPTDADSILAQMRELVEQSLHNARDILATLRPKPQVPRHLAETVRQYVEDYAQTYGITAITRILGEDDQLDEEERDTFYQVLREAMTNVRKHAQARTVNISLDVRQRPYSLVVEDDGVGLDLQAAADKAGSFGLLGMRERAALLGGDIEINNGPMGGTRVTFYGPPDALRGS